MNAAPDVSEVRAGGGFGSRIASDSFVYGLGGIANQAVAILLVPIYARVLDVDGVGVTGVLNSIISLSLMLAGLALPQAFFRWYLREARDHANRAHILGTTLAIRIAASLAGFALVLLGAVPLTALLYDGPTWPSSRSPRPSSCSTRSTRSRCRCCEPSDARATTWSSASPAPSPQRC